MEALSRSRVKWQYTFLIVFLCVINNISSNPVIQTNLGKIKGISVDGTDGKKVNAYLGIPFAKPPLGDLRFKHPQKIDPWNGIFNASTKPNSCHQILDTFYGPDFAGSKIWNANTKMSEDCLYLNVWVPTPTPQAKSLSVLVWIFGGGFYSGSSTLDLYDGQYLASAENIIVVSMNYRVASLGYLYLEGRKDAPGNAGMLDQVMALQWVYDNIEAFGGIRENITLFGESAGAASISMHLISPLSKHLFKNAIIQSASALSPWAVLSNEELERTSINLGKLIKCDNETNKDVLMDCLRKADPTELVNIEFGARPLDVNDFPFCPVVDEYFLLEHPKESVRKGNFKKTNLLAGSNKNEGFYFLLYYFPSLLPLVENVTVSRAGFLNAVKNSHHKFSDLQDKAAIYEYTDWAKVDDVDVNRDMLDKFSGDESFHCPTQEFSLAYSAGNNDVYMYHYNHRYSTNPFPSWTGVLHADEIFMIFGEPVKPSKNYTPAEKTLSRKLMKYWANFAKTGNPNEGSNNPDSKLVEWKKCTPENKEYLFIAENSRMESTVPRLNKCAFWRELMPLLGTTNDTRCDKDGNGIENEEVMNALKSSTRKNSSKFLIIGTVTILLSICTNKILA